MTTGKHRKQSTLYGPGSGWYEPRPKPEIPAPEHSAAAKLGHRRAGRTGGDGSVTPGHLGRPSAAEGRAAARRSYLERAEPGTTDWFQFMGPTGRADLDLVGHPGGGDIGLYAQEGVRPERLEIVSRIIARMPATVQGTTRQVFVYRDFLQDGDLPGMKITGDESDTLGFAKGDTIHIFGAGQKVHDDRAYEAKAEYVINHELAHGMYERLDFELKDFLRDSPSTLHGKERRAFNHRLWEEEELELKELNDWETGRERAIEDWEYRQKRKVSQHGYKRQGTVDRKHEDIEQEAFKRKRMLENVYQHRKFLIEMATWEPLLQRAGREDLLHFWHFQHETQQGDSDASFYVTQHQVFSDPSTVSNENFAEYMRLSNSVHVEPWRFEELQARPAWPHFRKLMAEQTQGHAVALDLEPEQIPMGVVG